MNHGPTGNNRKKSYQPSPAEQSAYESIDSMLSKEFPINDQICDLRSKVRGTQTIYYRQQLFHWWKGIESSFISMQEEDAPVAKGLHILENFHQEIYSDLYKVLNSQKKLVFPEVGIKHLEWISTEGLRSEDHIRLATHAVKILWEPLRDDEINNCFNPEKLSELGDILAKIIRAAISIDGNVDLKRKAIVFCRELVRLPTICNSYDLLESCKELFEHIYPLVRDTMLLDSDSSDSQLRYFSYESRVGIDPDLKGQLQGGLFYTSSDWYPDINEEDEDLNQNALFVEASSLMESLSQRLVNMSSRKDDITQTQSDTTFWTTYLQTLPLNSPLWTRGIQGLERVNQVEYRAALLQLIKDCAESELAAAHLIALTIDYKYKYFSPKFKYDSQITQLKSFLSAEQRRNIAFFIKQSADSYYENVTKIADAVIYTRDVEYTINDIVNLLLEDS